MQLHTYHLINRQHIFWKKQQHVLFIGANGKHVCVNTKEAGVLK